MITQKHISKEKIIVVSVGGIDAVKPEIITNLNQGFGADGYLVIDPKDLKQHIIETKAPSFEKSIPLINTHELLPEIKLKEPSKPIDAILKNKRYK